MKLLALAAATMAALFASKAAVAQTVVYDAITNATVANYYTGPGNNLGGDIFNLGAAGNATGTEFVIVADVAGSCTFTVCFWDLGAGAIPPLPAAFASPPLPAPCCVNVTVNIPAPGVYIVSAAGFNCPLPAGNIGYSIQFNCPDFYLAYDNSAAIPAGSDYDGFTIDTNVNGVLEPGAPVNEWYTFDPTWTNANLLFNVTTTPSPMALAGPFAAPQASARKLDLPTRKFKALLSKVDLKK